MQDMQHRRRAQIRAWGLWLTLLALLAACGGPVATEEGGQSGTDESDGGSACKPHPTQALAPEDRISEVGLTADEVLARIVEPLSLTGLWFASRDSSELTVQSSNMSVQYTPSRTDDGVVCDWSLEVAASLNVASRDGFVAVAAPANISWGVGGTVLIRAALPEVDVEGVPVADLPVSYGLSVALHQALGNVSGVVLAGLMYDDVVSLALYRDADVLGFWTSNPELVPLPPVNPTPYEPPPALREGCMGAAAFRDQDAQPQAVFANEEAARLGIAATWLRCLDNVESSHVGLQLHPDGTWNELVLEQGELRPRRGFDHEGVAYLQAASMLQSPGLFQVDFLPGARAARASSEALVLWPQETHWPAPVYLRSELAVSAAETAVHARGARTGDAGCDVTEQGVTPLFEDVVPLLTGEYTLCSGALPGNVARIRFAADHVELLGPEGALLESEPYQFDGMLQPNLSLIVGQLKHQWRIVAARQPLKLQIRELTGTGVETAVFSAVP